MKHIFWLVENELCGRPGPNHEPWDLIQLKEQAGIHAILSVNAADAVYEDELAAAGLDHRCIPLAANAPPRPGEKALCLERLPEAFDFVSSYALAAKPVLVHCRQGKDRTGLFMAYYLRRRYGLDLDQAISRLMAVRPIALSAEGWDQFARDVLEAAT